MVYFFHRYELPSIWVANENDTDYDSDASYSVDNYTVAPDAVLMDDDEGSNVQETSAPSQESNLQDALPTTSLVTGSGNSHSQSTAPVAKKKEMNSPKENRSAVSGSSHVIA
ncbi:hypothetical protein AVEN_109093-1 [Araneus ventricosus]|uniref:Uncharacterized protein n=1 Tax=Araneus ventricosus TaxID=182803 RepID=A0A4Y2I9D7_ARAVE|nr:hypothetical protein AVEN_109093-1 [Araneus ventricosus]